MRFTVEGNVGLVASPSYPLEVPGEEEKGLFARLGD
jgi:hypothetical protein